MDSEQIAPIRERLISLRRARTCWRDESLPGYAWAGAALIMAGVLVVGLRPGLATQEA
jgi:hypothetical protein